MLQDYNTSTLYLPHAQPQHYIKASQLWTFSTMERIARADDPHVNTPNNGAATNTSTLVPAAVAYIAHVRQAMRRSQS